MAFYVPVGPRGILFRFGMTWTKLLGGFTYWSLRPKALKGQSLDIYPMLHSPRDLPRLPRSSASIPTRIGWRSIPAETEHEPVRAILQFEPARVAKTMKLPESRETVADMLDTGHTMEAHVPHTLAVWEAISDEGTAPGSVR